MCAPAFARTVKRRCRCPPYYYRKSGEKKSGEKSGAGSWPEVGSDEIPVNLAHSPFDRRLRAVADWRAGACDARVDSGGTGRGRVFGRNEAGVHCDPDQLVAGVVLRAATAVDHRVALVKADYQQQ